MLLAAVVGYAVMLARLLASVLAESLSLDFNSMIDMAFSIINSLWPLFVIPMGFMFGLALIGWIISEIKKAIPHA